MSVVLYLVLFKATFPVFCSGYWEPSCPGVLYEVFIWSSTGLSMTHTKLYSVKFTNKPNYHNIVVTVVFYLLL